MPSRSAVVAAMLLLSSAALLASPTRAALSCTQTLYSHTKYYNSALTTYGVFSSGLWPFRLPRGKCTCAAFLFALACRRGPRTQQADAAVRAARLSLACRGPLGVLLSSIDGGEHARLSLSALRSASGCYLWSGRRDSEAARRRGRGAGCLSIPPPPSLLCARSGSSQLTGAGRLTVSRRSRLIPPPPPIPPGEKWQPLSYAAFRRAKARTEMRCMVVSLSSRSW